MDFRVTRTFELFEDHVVHARTGVDERGGDDRQRSAFYDVAGGADETLRTLQRVRVDTTGEDLAARRNDRVVRARQTCDRVEQDHDVAFVFDESFRLLDNHVGYLNVACRRFVEG